MKRLTSIVFLCWAFANLQAQIIMFPGDANKDGVANHYDLLPIGVAYGKEGIPRPGASPLWQPQFHPFPWLQILPSSGINLAFVDSDGNGFIDSLDIDPIALNFDSTQNASQPPPMPYLLPDTCFSCPKPDLLITFDRDTAMVNDTFFATLTLRYPPDVPPFMGALGVAFNLTYDPLNVKDDLIEVFPDSLPDDLMFVTATNKKAKATRAVPEGLIGFGASGKGQNAFSNPRELGKVKIVVEDMVIRSLPVIAPFWLDASNILIVNEMEQVICPGIVVVDTIRLFDPVNGAHEVLSWENGVALFPNPAGELLFIESPEAALVGLEVFNQYGTLVFDVITAPVFQTHIALGGLVPGLYFVKIRTRSGWTVRKFQAG